MLQLQLSISCPLICQAMILLTTNAILYPPDHHDAERNCVARLDGAAPVNPCHVGPCKAGPLDPPMEGPCRAGPFGPAECCYSSVTGVQERSGLKRSIFLNSAIVAGPKSFRRPHRPG